MTFLKLNPLLVKKNKVKTRDQLNTMKISGLSKQILFIMIAKYFSLFLDKENGDSNENDVSDESR